MVGATSYAISGSGLNKLFVTAESLRGQVC